MMRRTPFSVGFRIGAAAVTITFELLWGSWIVAATDLKTLSSADIRTLQERMWDAHCYTGPVDGQATSAQAALNSCPTMDPILGIETGMHTAVVKRIGVDRACRLLATGSDDKTVRLWSLPEGRLLRVLRPPIGYDAEGKIYAVAISPNGALVAAGGYDARLPIKDNASVYLFDAQTGTLRSRVGEFESVINHLVFSGDGRYLAVMLGGAKGLRVIDIQRMVEVAADRNYGSSGYGAAFAPDGRLYTVALDGYLRVYDREFRLTKKIATRGKQPFSVAVQPGGAHVAVAHADSTEVDIYRATDLSVAYSANTFGIGDGNLYSVAWSADGRRLVAGGRSADAQSKYPLVIWDREGRGARHEQEVASDTIADLQPCGTGFALGAHDPLWALLGQDGQRLIVKAAPLVDMRDKRGDAFKVSRDGRQVWFGLGHGADQPVLFDLSRQILIKGESSSGLSAPNLTGIEITDWLHEFVPRLAGKALPLDQRERSRSLAITSDGTGFVLGTEWHLRAFDKDGQERWKTTAPSPALGVNITADGRLVLAAYYDGTIRWHRMRDGQELLALFVNKDNQRWVAWTPSGYYMASPGGEDLLGWHVNRGWDQAADFFPASRFRERFSRPDVVQKVLDTLDEAEAIEETEHDANVHTDAPPVAINLPPVIKFVSPTDGRVGDGGEVTLEYELRSPSALPVETLDVLIDGRLSQSIKHTSGATGETLRERQVVRVPADAKEVGLVARSGSMASELAALVLRQMGISQAPATEELVKPELFGLVVGVSEYDNKDLTLKYAAKDAEDFAATLRAQRGRLYRDVELTVLTDKLATSSAIKDALEALPRAMTSRDIAVIFFAGHGYQDNRNAYYYLAANSDTRRLLTTTVEGTVLREVLRSLPGKVLLFLDTCYAGSAMQQITPRGAVDINAVLNDLSSAENGIVTYAASTGREVSYENDSWGNGAFTKALKEGLGDTEHSGKADFTRHGVITTAALDLWLSERVKALTSGAQHPVMIRPGTISDFPMFVSVH
jgi:WD40 repeat protein